MRDGPGSWWWWRWHGIKPGNFALRIFPSFSCNVVSFPSLFLYFSSKVLFYTSYFN